MATLEEQLRVEQEKLRKAETLLASAENAAKVQGKQTSPAITKGTKAVADSKRKIADLRSKIERNKQDAAEGQMTAKQKQERNIREVKNTLPFATDEKLLNGLIDIVGPNISVEMFQRGGALAGAVVYQGEKASTTTSPTGTSYAAKVPNEALTNDVVNSFWTDKKVQNKVLSALVAAGKKDATQLDAFATWQSVVQQSAQLYAAGKGPKFTPMDILNMSITKAGGPKKPDVTTYLDVPRESELREKMKDRIFELIQMRPKDNDPILQKLVADIKSVYEKGVTTTTTVNPKTGKKTVTQKGGVSEELIQSKLNNYYNSGNQDYLEAKSIEAADYFSRWMRS